MEEQEILRRLQETDEKLDKIYKSTERTRKYFLWTMIMSFVVIALPFIGLIVLLPMILSVLGGASDANKALDLLGL